MFTQDKAPVSLKCMGGISSWHFRESAYRSGKAEVSLRMLFIDFPLAPGLGPGCRVAYSADLGLGGIGTATSPHFPSSFIKVTHLHPLFRDSSISIYLRGHCDLFPSPHGVSQTVQANGLFLQPRQNGRCYHFMNI